MQTPDSVINKVNDEKSDGFKKTLEVFDTLAKLNKFTADPGETNNRAAKDAHEIVDAFFPGLAMRARTGYVGRFNNAIGSIITKLI